MLRHIKYEYRKNLTLYIILAAILFGTQAFTTIAILSQNETLLGFAVMILLEGVWALILFFMIMSIITYSRELGSKASYLSFMTPQSPFAIIGARYLSMLLTTVVASAVFIGFIYLDFNLILAQYSDINDFVEFFQIFISAGGYQDIIQSMVTTLIIAWLFIIAAICIIFFAITLSHTLLENSRGKGGLSFAFVVGISAITIFALVKLPSFDLGDEGFYILLNSWPDILLLCAISAGSYVGSAFLLDKKLSL